MDNTVGSLTQFQKSVIIGTLLGDGYLRIIPGRRNAFLEINHSYHQKEYVDWKYNILKSIAGSQPKVREGIGNRIAYRFYTRQHSELTQYWKMFYRNGKKIIPDINIDSVSLAVWFMDDGSRCRDYDVYLNTQQYNSKDQLKVLSILESFELKAKLNKDKHYWRLRFLKSSILRLNHLIAEYIIPSMKYKLSYDPVETQSSLF